ncbi:MAG: phosphatidylserine decarboxylase family protein [Phycisphaerales bacterium]|nr:phosphatidylserine decarboxylase family protein [Phycisphaerales bacterium]
MIGAALTAAIGWYFAWFALIPGLIAIALLLFYRDPPRRPPQDPRFLLAPADGRIMRIDRDYRVGADVAPELRICIFLSVLDVHLNRAPCAGVVREVVHTPGKFLNALKEEATLRNENSLMRIEPRSPIPGPVHVRQIAGLLAKRIVCAAAPGDHLAAGERFGMIKLGSQTELRAPESPDWTVGVEVGQLVKGGETILARLEMGG